MIQILFSVCLLLLTAVVAQAEAVKAPIASPGPVTVVEYWASWCGSCRENVPKLVSAFASKAQGEVRIELVSLDEDIAIAKSFLQNLNLPSTPSLEIAFDPTGVRAKAAQLEAMPTTIVFDQSGKERFRLSVTDEAELEKIRSVVQALLGERLALPDVAA